MTIAKCPFEDSVNDSGQGALTGQGKDEPASKKIMPVRHLRSLVYIVYFRLYLVLNKARCKLEKYA